MEKAGDAMIRARLANKRFGVNVAIEADAIEAVCTVNPFPDGRPGEVFCEVQNIKVGTQLDLITKDSAVLLSLLYQHEVPAPSIAASLARIEGNRPATIVGAMADLAARLHVAASEAT